MKDMDYPSSKGSGKQSTRGAGVKSGLSKQKSFHGTSNRELGLDTNSSSKNQVPIHPKHKLSTDRGKFTCH